MIISLKKAQQHIQHSSRWLVVAALLLAYGLMVSSALRKSATVDEQSHLFRGVAYLQEGATHFLLGHPLLASSLSALPVLTEPNLALPINDPAWNQGNWSIAGDAFLWRINENPQRILFLGRLPVMWLTLLLLALIYRWGKELAGSTVALLAFLLATFDPNMLANGRIISGDIPLTLFFVLTLYGYWRWAVHNSGWRSLVLAGVGLGFASVSKFNAALLLPVLGLLGLWLAWRRRSWRPLLVLLLVGAVGGVVIWLSYGLAIRPLPGGAFWDDLFWELQYFGKAHGSYLAGDYSTTGWWYYFPFAFAIKTPLITLLLLASAFASLVRNVAKDWQTIWFLLLPVAVYFIVSLFSSLNIGYRYLLPTLPFLWLFTAVSLGKFPQKWRTFFQWVGGVGVVWLLFQAVVIWPDYIPYFNQLAGEPDDSWRLLSDSNIDWGQDLPALAAWQRESGEVVKLSYFGTAHPSAYDIEFEPLPMWAPAPEQAFPGRQLYDPMNPAPGIYALSVTSLHGVVLAEQRDAFAWFRNQTPLQRLGQSIFLYEVLSKGDPVDLVLLGMEPAQLAPQVRSHLAGNDLRVRWLNGGSAMLWPAGVGWLVVGEEQIVGEALRPFLDEAESVVQIEGQTLYRLTQPVELGSQEQYPFGDLLTLQNVELLSSDITAANEIVMLTTWKVLTKNSRPLKIFVHALDTEGNIIGQWDGLEIDPTSWQPDDLFLQQHQFIVDNLKFPAHFLLGVYDGETLERVGEPYIVSAK